MIPLALGDNLEWVQILAILLGSQRAKHGGLVLLDDFLRYQ